MNTVEMWKPISGYEGIYEVSSLGRVRSLDRSIRNKWGGFTLARGRMLSLCPDNIGYIIVGLHKNGLRTTCKVHRLVAEAFFNNYAGEEINHIDLDKKNNRVDNLEICTRSRNMQHASLHGAVRAATNPRRRKKMTPESVAALRAAHDAGANYVQLGMQFGINPVTALRIVRRERWA